MNRFTTPTISFAKGNGNTIISISRYAFQLLGEPTLLTFFIYNDEIKVRFPIEGDKPRQIRNKDKICFGHIIKQTSANMGITTKQQRGVFVISRDGNNLTLTRV